jgi:hypothetical protein
LYSTPTLNPAPISFPFFILIGFGIGLAVLFLFRRDLNKTKQQIPPENRRKLSYLYLVQIGGLGLTEIGILICTSEEQFKTGDRCMISVRPESALLNQSEDRQKVLIILVEL